MGAQTEESTTTLRAYRFVLVPTPQQLEALARHAGAARWAYNFALERKVSAHAAYTKRIAALTEEGLSPQEAKARFKQEVATLRATATVWDHHRQTLFNRKTGRPDPAKSPTGPQELISRLASVRAAIRDGDELAGELKNARERVAEVKAELFATGAQIPAAMDNLSVWRQTRDRPREEGGSPWHAQVSSYAFSCGMTHADTAWKNWLESFQGLRKGRRVGYPRFKAKGRARDSCTLYHDVKAPKIRVADYRHLDIPNIGRVQVQETGHRAGTRKRADARTQGKGRLSTPAKRLMRMVERGDAIVQSVNLSRGADRWYASVLVKHTPNAMREREYVTRMRQRASEKRQATRPRVGVEWGVRTLVTLSDGTCFENPRHGKRGARALRKASRALSRKPYTRGQPSSANRAKALARFGKIHHRIAEARKGSLHQITAKIAVNYPVVAVRDLDVLGMTKSVKGSLEKPGRQVKLKARFNRAVLDAAPATLRAQLAYKTAQYGTELRVAPKSLPSSQTCSKCGWRDPSIPLEQRTFQCGNIACGLELDRELNAARNIRKHAVAVAPDSEETLNACGDGVGPPGSRGQPSVKQEDRPPLEGRSFRGSDSPAPTTP